MISPATIERIRDAVRIEDVVSDFVTLRKAGANLQACCPFHQEKTPSFVVNPARNGFKCFGCDKGGDAITFLREQGKSYPDALRWLAQKYNIEVEETAMQPDLDHDAKTELRATASVLQAHFALQDIDDNPGRRYWIGRGFQSETLDTFGIGYCSGDKPQHVTDESLRAIGAINEKGNLLFYKRTTIPLHDRMGAVIGWAGRSLETSKEVAKYINSPETLIYQKSRFLYNLHRATPHIRKTQEIWIVEGYADCMALHQCGVLNAVAISGTALTDAHANELRRFNGDRSLRFILCYDNEIDPNSKDAYKSSVAKAYQAALEKLLPIGEVLVVKYPKECKDMADVMRRGGEPRSIEKRDAIVDYVEVNYSKDFREKASPVEKGEFQDIVSKMLAHIKRDNVRDIYINQFSSMLEIKPAALDKRVKEFRTERDTEEKNRVANEYRYIKVADEYYQRGVDHDIFTKTNTVVYRRRKRQELATEGVGITSIPRFHDWICMPNHLNYQRTLEITYQEEKFQFFNSYQPLPHRPKEFDLPAEFYKDPEGFDYERIPEIRNTAAFMKHIFDHKRYGNRYLTIGWDWVSLCYLEPTQRLQALALVSSDEGTGKSTFINLLLAIFGQNATKTEARRIGSNFNAMAGGKVLQCVEETKDDRGEIENILKDLITAHEKVVEAKHENARVVKSFDKYVFCSNHEDSFMKVGTSTTRFFVMKVNPIENKVPDFEEKLYLEIPYVLHFMQKRKVLTPKEDRLWFNPRLLENEALLKLRHASKDQVQQVMEELFSNIFLRCELTSPMLYLGSTYLKLLMIAYGGKSYEQKTPMYFLNTATKDMRLHYNDTPIGRDIIELTGIHADMWINAETWASEKKRSKNRFIEVPIWKYVTPADIRANYDAQKRLALIENLRAALPDLEATYGKEPERWLDALAGSDDMPF